MRVPTPKGIITLLVVVLVVLVFSVMPVAAQSQGTMRFSPDTMSLRDGESAVIEVWISGVVDVYGCDVVVGFDASSISVSSIQPGGFLESGFVIASTIENGKGWLEYAATQVAPSQPKSGDGVLFKFTITTKGGGNSQLKFSRSTMSLMDGTLITLEDTRATISIIESTPTIVPNQIPVYIPPTPAPTVAEPIATPTEIQMIQPSSTNLPEATPTSEPVTPTESPAVTVTPTPVLATPETGLTQADQVFLNVMWWSMLGGLVFVIILLAWRTFKPNAKK